MKFDIIIFALIAAFFIWKLRQVLGQRNGSERDRGNPFERAAERLAERVKEAEADRAKGQPTIIDGVAIEVKDTAPQGSLAGAIGQVRALDPTFDEKRFLAGARAAFTMIVEAFAAGDVTTLKNLLRPTVLSGFVAEIERRKAAGEASDVKINRLLQADIAGARTEGKTAVVTVDFTSEQISVTRNAGGEVIDGDPKKLQLVAESWTFERDTSQRDPNWHLVATRSR